MLRIADSGDIKPFIDYIADNLKRSLDIMLSGAKGESIEEADDIDKEIALLKQKVKTVQTLEIVKSKKSIVNIFDNSFLPLFHKFNSKCQLLDDLYFSSNQLIMIENQGSHINTQSPNYKFEELRDRVKKEYPGRIYMEYTYTTFKLSNQLSHHIPKENGEFSSKITFQFDEIHYFVFDSRREKLIKKMYHEHITEDEILDLVNYEIKFHKAFIELQIKEIEKNK